MSSVKHFGHADILLRNTTAIFSIKYINVITSEYAI